MAPTDSVKLKTKYIILLAPNKIEVKSLVISNQLIQSPIVAVRDTGSFHLFPLSTFHKTTSFFTCQFPSGCLTHIYNVVNITISASLLNIKITIPLNSISAFNIFILKHKLCFLSCIHEIYTQYIFINNINIIIKKIELCVVC